MFKKITIAIITLSVVALAGSPVKVKKSDFWWKTTKTSIENFVKSIKIEWDNEKAVKMIEKGLDKAKERTEKIIKEMEKNSEEKKETKAIDTSNKEVV